VSAVVMVAKTQIDAEQGRRAETWRDVNRRSHDNGSRVDDDWRRLNVNRSGCYDTRNGDYRSWSDGVNRRASMSDCGGVYRRGMKGVGGCGLDTGGGHCGETQNCDSFFHAFVFH
jgi:hypothetical protein